MLSAKEVVERAGRIHGDYLVSEQMEKKHNPPNTLPKSRWTLPSGNTVKRNVDAAVLLGHMGFGAVARNSDGTVVGAAAVKLLGHLFPHIAECLAIREGVAYARRQGFEKWIVESDVINVVHAVKDPIIQSMETNVIEDVRSIFVGACCGSCCYTFREGNHVAYTLANHALLSFL